MSARKRMRESRRNCLQTEKIEAYLGFARRAGILTLGVNAIGTLKRGVHLLLLDGSMAQNSRKEMMKYGAQFACPLLEAKDLGVLVKKQGCKAAAVRDISLAKAIFERAEEAGLTTIGGLNG